MKEIKSVHDLVGEELAAVSFVRDYVEFHFDGPVLRALENPSVVALDGAEFLFPAAGSRDASCSAIGATVTAIDIDEERSLRMALSDGSRIEIRLDGGRIEAMNFMDRRGGGMWIW